MQKMTKYRITDSHGKELGEATGATRAEALVTLQRMDPKAPRLSLSEAKVLVEQRLVRFEVLA
jgi:hypothetical protein